MPRKYAVVTTLIVGFAYFAAPGLPQEDKGAEKSAAKSQSESGVYLAVSLPPALRAGSPVPLTVILKNSGKENANLQLFVGNGLPFVALAVEDKKGNSTPLTLRGKKYLYPTDRADVILAGEGSFRARTLKPAQTSDLSVENLALFYDLTLAGDYSVTVEKTLRIGSGEATRKVRLKAKVQFTIENP